MRKLVFCAVVLSGCAGGEASDSVKVESFVTGDTTVVLSTGIPPVAEENPVRIVWQSDELERPNTMTAVGDALLIGDGTRIHLLPSSGGPARTFGRDGEGPGEFRYITSVGHIGSDTLLVFDVSLHRLSYLDLNGNLLQVVTVSTAPPFVNPSRDGEPLIAMDQDILWTRGENAYTSRRGRIALIRHDLAADSATVLEVWEDVQFRQAGQYFTTTELFPARALYALSGDGRVAAGDGQEYCFVLSSVEGTDVVRACREWERAEIGPEIRSPDYSVLDDPSYEEVLEELDQIQDVGDRMPSFDRLWFAEDGELWVRTVGEELSRVHPSILWRRPDLGPPARSWDVFDQGGRLQRTLKIPSNFNPRAMCGGRIFGFLELPTGEIAIGEMAVHGDTAFAEDGR